MPWTPDIAYLDGLDFFDGVVRMFGPEDWHAQSPCAGWNAMDVLGHVGMGVDFDTKLLREESPEWQLVEPPENVVSGNPGQWWNVKINPAKDSVRGAVASFGDGCIRRV